MLHLCALHHDVPTIVRCGMTAIQGTLGPNLIRFRADQIGVHPYIEHMQYKDLYILGFSRNFSNAENSPVFHIRR